MQGTGGDNFEKKGKPKGYIESAEQARKRNIRINRHRAQRRKQKVNPGQVLATEHAAQ